MKVLVVESNQMLRPFISNMLAESDFMVESTPFGKEGVKWFVDHSPSAVILAMELSDVAGLQVLIKMHELNVNIPIIVISTDETIPTAVKMVRAGAYDYVPKSNLIHLPAILRDAIKIGESPELVHEKMHTEGKAKGAKVHRKHDRVPLRQEVKVDGHYMGKSINISRSGMFIHTGRSHQIGSPCQLEFLLLGKMVRVQGVVKQSEFSVGMGVAFVDLHPDIRRAIELLVINSLTDQKGKMEKKKWILLISDDQSALRMYKSQFMLSGFSILETKSLDKAAEYLREKIVSCIVIDIDMQGVDAKKIVQSIKSAEALAKIPVVAFTSSYNSDAAEGLKAAGAAYFASRMTTPPKKLSQILEKLDSMRKPRRK